MTANYVLLGTQTVGSAGASSVTFSNIPQTGYTDLKLSVSARHATSFSTSYVRFNSTTTNYSYKRLFLNGTSVMSDSGAAPLFENPASYTANTFCNAEVMIPNYSGSNKKSFYIDSVTENNATSNYNAIVACLWDNISAITSITVAPDAGNFAEGSTFYLYGLAAVGTTPVIAPQALGGDVVANDGTYWYHAFKTSGTFTPSKALTADILVVAGGGGGGTSTPYNGAGGGGAGGLLAFTSQALTATSYTCTVGAGGAIDTNGVNSQFGSLTATVGGGKGGNGNAVNGSSGGSGGGAGSNASGGSATSGQGNVGANSAYNSAGGGGGGAGGAASNVSGAGQGSNGGAGVNTYSTWATATTTGASGYYAGGGGGGSYTGYSVATGSGGGGNGGVAAVGSNGTANTGGGGGAGGNSGSAYAGGAGGSGVVIIRYAMA